MMQQEFERMVGTEVTAEDYKVIELVYMEHPLIPSAGGKAKVKALYEIGGVGIFRLLQPEAETMLRLRNEVVEAEKMLERLKNSVKATEESISKKYL